MQVPELDGTLLAHAFEVETEVRVILDENDDSSNMHRDAIDEGRGGDNDKDAGAADDPVASDSLTHSRSVRLPSW